MLKTYSSSFHVNTFILFEFWFFIRLVGVVLDIKLWEECKKEEGVGTDVVGKLPGEVTIVIENELECMNHDAHKLHHLQCGQVLLPPEEPKHKRRTNG